MSAYLIPPAVACFQCGCTDDHPCIVNNQPCHWLSEADAQMAPPALWLDTGPLCSVCRNGIAHRLYALACGYASPVEAYGPRDLTELLDGEEDDPSRPIEVRLLGGRYRELRGLQLAGGLTEFDGAELSLIIDLLATPADEPAILLMRSLPDDLR